MIEHGKINNWIKTTRDITATAVKDLDPNDYMKDLDPNDYIKDIDATRWNNGLKTLKLSILSYSARLTGILSSRSLFRYLAANSSNPAIANASRHQIIIGHMSISTILIVAITTHRAYFWRKQWLALKNSAK
jgi:hypothetical protein